MILLSTFDLSLAAILILVLAVLNASLRLGQARTLIIAAIRSAVQLTLIGLVLKTVFAATGWWWIALIAMVMFLVAGREVMMRQTRRFSGWWGFGVGASSMFVSALCVTLMALIVVIGPTPWYEPRYAIPLFGMMLGNTMNGVAISLDRLTQTAWQQRTVIEAHLMLGHDWSRAVADIRRESARSGLMPMINAMAASGVVSLPGMMTGQILAGADPVEAVKYQILIMFLISAGTGFGTLAAVWLGSRRLFDERERLRLDRLRG